MKEIKKQLRKEIAQAKKKQAVSTLEAASDALLTQLEEHPRFKEADTILMYYALPDEVRTQKFVEKWHHSKRILLPVVVGDLLELKVYEGKESMKEGAFHIDEPTGDTFTDYDKIQLTLVPGVSFDKHGNRLGRGKGYYDRLLPNINAPKIGICFQFQIIEEIPTDKYDYPMDAVLTEYNLYNNRSTNFCIQISK